MSRGSFLNSLIAARFHSTLYDPVTLQLSDQFGLNLPVHHRQFPGNCRIDKEDAGTGIGERVRDLAGREPKIERHRDRAEHLGREISGDRVLRRGDVEGHAVAGTHAQIRQALGEVAAVERSALALSEIGGLDTDEIAERLGTDPAIIRTLLDRARESVRTSLAARGRRGVTALLPFQSLWQLGSAAPTMRAAGLIAAAVIALAVAVGVAAADAPRSR